jgi:hypothetical protein
MHVAAATGSRVIIKMLLHRGLVNSKDDVGLTPLHWGKLLATFNLFRPQAHT